MTLTPSNWPRRISLAYIGLVFLAWVMALAPSPFSNAAQVWPIIVALPWSLFLLAEGSLFGIFIAGLLNAALLYILLAGWRRPFPARRRLLLPPAA